MIEAFEIGVSLALQDGVSDAIGKARRDVAALEHAVRESGVSVQSLRDAGARVSSVSFDDRPSPAVEEPVARVVPEVAPATEKEAETVPFVPLLTAIRTEQAAGGAQGALAPTAEAPAQEADIAAPRLPAAAPMASIPSARESVGVTSFFVGTPAAGVGESTQEGRAEASARLAALGPADAPAGAAVTRGDGVAPVVLSAREREAERPAALGAAALPAQPGAPLLGQNGGEQSFSPAPPNVSSTDEVLQGARSTVSLLNALRYSGGSVEVAQVEDQYFAQQGAAPVAGDDGQSDDEQQAPAVAARGYGAAPSGGAANSGARAERVPQQAEAGAAGPQEGDVFLDGMLVGRWMSKFLTREAERASAGPTGFDARRGRLLPGVTVGG